ncbi:flagellar biosynthetic protein FliO [Bacillus sp. DTU_2020_1000418_1_SI_GHA_SEK_038]|uniref:flagellar biosynthetic protein FliO n=1 Tax=Bacillus sp. DTU_2020_1000418_1_SI_GHA_SEK_038 TaxID=3077585 RepID=UPI0028EB0324|nr:flagellar biosynthetic protein FliO [Bacillus sp. DTU_2020_1000418_1_SI_GHA_SEK_038]WNS77186.1 flagellar biosynthetic protein FliO [Bacillus sp. DTU_2020_1000418_1_SI_GHA_SEK_038]
MQYFKRTIFSLFLISFALLGIHAPAYAEQVNSVKDCIEHPDTCDQDQIPQKQETTKNEQPVKVGLNAFDFVKMIFATVFVVGLLYFLLKFINKKSKMYKSSQLVENLGGTALGTNRSIQLIKVGNRILVVGVGENIQLLMEIEDQEEYNQLLSDYNEKMEQLVQPSDIVTKVLQLRKNVQPDEKPGNHFQSLLKQQLEDITKGRKQLYKEMEKKGTDEQ